MKDSIPTIPETVVGNIQAKNAKTINRKVLDIPCICLLVSAPVDWALMRACLRNSKNIAMWVATIANIGVHIPIKFLMIL